MQALSSLFRNSTFSIITNVLNRLGNAIIFILIVRWLGIDNGGIYTLGTAYFIIGSRFAFWGLDHLLTREVSKYKHKSSLYISNFLLLRIILATICILILSLIIQIPNYTNETQLILFLMLLSIWPECINNLSWATFAAHEEFHFTSISVFFGSLFQIVFGYLLLKAGYGLLAMAVVFFINNMIAMSLNLIIISKRYKPSFKQLNFNFIRSNLPIATPFIFISVFYILDNRVDTILLSFFTTETEIGIYGAAVAIILAVTMIPQGYRIAVLPIMAKYHQTNETQLTQLYQKSYKYLLILGLPITFAILILADEALNLVFRQPLPDAVPVLQIMSISIVFLFLNVLDARLLIVFNHQKLIAKILLFSLLINLTINILLTPSYGAAGAGMARLVSVFFVFLLNTWIVKRFVEMPKRWLFWIKPLFSSFVMMFALYFFSSSVLIVQIIIGVITYFGCSLMVGTFSGQEINLFKALMSKLLVPIVNKIKISSR